MNSVSIVDLFWLGVAAALTYPVLQLVAVSKSRNLPFLLASLAPALAIAAWLATQLFSGARMNWFLPAFPFYFIVIDLYLGLVLLSLALSGRRAADDA